MLYHQKGFVLEDVIIFLSEDYRNFMLVDSGKALQPIIFENGTKVFSNISEDHRYFFEANGISGNFKRPEIAMFPAKRKLIFLNYLGLNEPLELYARHMIKYARILACASRGFFKQFYGYVIGGIINELGLDSSYIKSNIGYIRANNFDTDGMGFFTEGILNEEILFYDDIHELVKIKLIMDKATDENDKNIN